MPFDIARPSAPARLSGRSLDWATLALLVAIWGTGFAGLKVAVETIPPVWVVAGRLWVASLALALWLGFLAATGRADARPLASRPVWLWMGLVGVAFTALPFFLFAIAAETTASAVLAICNGGAPLFTAVFAHFLLVGERLGWRRALGIGLGFVGLLILAGPELAADPLAGPSAVAGFGVILGIAGAALYSGGNIATRLAPRVSPVVSSLVMTLTGAIAIAVLGLPATPPPAAPSAASIVAVVLLGLLPTAFATILYVWLIQRSGPMFVAYATYLTPLWAAGVGVGFMGEAIDVFMALALAFILGGLFIANTRARLTGGGNARIPGAGQSLPTATSPSARMGDIEDGPSGQTGGAP
jgi:drug/metabolite transporter (DMT)-like permease